MACSIVTIYVNWDTNEVVGEPEKEDWIKVRVSKYLNDMDKFSDWLDGNYEAAEVFHMTDKEKEKALDYYREEVYDEAKADFIREFEETEVKIE